MPRRLAEYVSILSLALLALPLLCLGPAAPAAAQTPVQGAEVNYTASNLPAPRDFDPPYQGEVTLGGGGGKDIAGGFIDALLPFWRWENSLLFINPRFNFGKTWNAFDGDSGDMQSGSIGLGWRIHLPDPGLILGANVYYDHLWSAKNNKFEQIGAGLEVMHQWFDLRFNYYWPLNDREHYDTLHTQQVSTWSEDWSREWTSRSSSYLAEGHHVLNKQDWWTTRQDWRSTFTQTFSQTFDLYEVALEGFDAEIGLAVPLPEAWGELRVFGGYMYFDSDYTDKYDGFTARLEYRPVRALALDLQWLEEDVFLGSNWTAGLRLTLPFDLGALAEGRNPFHNLAEWFSPGARSLDQRLTEMVKRDSYTHNAGEIKEREHERSLVTTKEDALLDQYITSRGSSRSYLLDPDGNPLFFYFVDINRSTGSDGTYEDPYAMPQQAVAALAADQPSNHVVISIAPGVYDETGLSHVIDDSSNPNLKSLGLTGDWQGYASYVQTGVLPALAQQPSWTLSQFQLAEGNRSFTLYGLKMLSDGLTPAGSSLLAFTPNSQAGNDLLAYGLDLEGAAGANYSGLRHQGHNLTVLSSSFNKFSTGLATDMNGGSVYMTGVAAHDNAGDGIYHRNAGSGDFSLLDSNVSNNSGSGLYISGGVSGNADLSRTKASYNGGSGIYINGGVTGNGVFSQVQAMANRSYGIYVGGIGGNADFSQAVASYNNNQGIVLSILGGGGNPSIGGWANFTNVEASHNNGDGITLTSRVGGSADFSGATASYNGGSRAGNLYGRGIVVGGSIGGPASFAGVTVLGNVTTGLEVNGVFNGDADFSGIQASNNGYHGIYLGYGIMGNAYFTGAQASGNGLVIQDPAYTNWGGAGIYLGGNISGSLDLSNAQTSGNLRGATASGNLYGAGVHLSGSVAGDVTAVGLQALNNQHNGFYAAGALGSSAQNTVNFSGAQASNNSGHGIYVGDGITGNADFSGATASSNGRVGIQTDAIGGNADFSSVTASNNLGYGIFVSAAITGNAVFSGATASSNGNHGIQTATITGSADFSEATASSNGRVGIQTDAIGGNADFSGATASFNGNHGIETTAIGGNAYFRDVTALSNGTEGINVTGAITGNADFSRANASSNGAGGVNGHGIQTVTITGNADFSSVTASNNLGRGIYVLGAISGNADFTGASASYNGAGGISVQGSLGSHAGNLHFFGEVWVSDNQAGHGLELGSIAGLARFHYVNAQNNGQNDVTATPYYGISIAELSAGALASFDEVNASGNKSQGNATDGSLNYYGINFSTPPAAGMAIYNNVTPSQ